MELIKILDILGPLLALPFVFLRKGRTRRENLVILFLVVQLVLNGIAKYIMIQPDGHNNNIFFYKLNAFLSFGIAGLFMLTILKKMLAAKAFGLIAAYYTVSLVVLLIILINESNTSFNSMSFSLTAFSVCLFCVIYYLNSLANPGDENIIQTSKFWLITAFFVYYGSNFFIFLTFGLLAKYNIKGLGLWGIHNVIFFISCCIILIAAKWIKK
ncbi:MAG: hypothetical protein ABIQ88_09495 [Chitinophagaceae bacterium]